MAFSSKISALAAAMAGVVSLGASVAHATTVFDPAGDILASCTTCQDGKDHSDLDVVSVRGLYNSTTLFLSSTQAGDVGTSAGNLYVWGVDRGKGQDTILTHSAGQPSVGVGVLFDAFITFDSTNSHNSINLVTYNPDKSVASVSGHAFDSSWVTISGRTISVAIPLSELPSTGFDVAHYGLNVWPRLGDTSNTSFIADFAPNGFEESPDGSPLFNASAVPEPATWAMMIAGFGLVGATLRRRSVSMAA